MDHYEELGIDRTAAEEEIRRAHRRLTKLLHPDQQTDEGLKQLAETQMRRLNSIVETLSDPQRRLEYDEGLRHGTAGFQASKFRRRAFHSWPWWVGSTIGAVVLTIGVVWFSADKWGSSFGDHSPTYIPSGAETGSGSEPSRSGSPSEAPASAPPTHASAPAVPAPEKSRVPVAPRTFEPRTFEPGTFTEVASSIPAPSRTVATVPTSAEIRLRKRLKLPLTAVSARPAPSRLNLPAAPALPTGVERVDTTQIATALLPSPKLPEPPSATLGRENSPAQPRDALEGEWVYAPTEPEKRKAGFYPPEYIDLRIWNEGGLRGEYRARYHVADKPIPPDVNFALAPDGNARHFTWASRNGSKGTLEVSSMDAVSIRIAWRTTVFGSAAGLTAGTATLVRRTP